MTNLMSYKLSKCIHMILHGIHHIIPMDPDRLVFPPVLFIVMNAIVYSIFSYFFTGSCLDIVTSGATFGYVCYDMIHYHIHHANLLNSYFVDMKKYHHSHHYMDDSAGYGISTKF
uniref:Ceramide very long chain fatty acid hydroxylase-like protein C19G12.08 n=1 Tax=Lygus hesperus TaxID=30085 RepID=A0A0A9ZAC8_LYGHE